MWYATQSGTKRYSTEIYVHPRGSFFWAVPAVSVFIIDTSNCLALWGPKEITPSTKKIDPICGTQHKVVRNATQLKSMSTLMDHFSGRFQPFPCLLSTPLIASHFGAPRKLPRLQRKLIQYVVRNTKWYETLLN